MKLLRPNETHLSHIDENLDHVLYFCINAEATEKRGTGTTSPGGKVSKMDIICSFSTSREGIRGYVRQFIDLFPLPVYITKNGPYVKNEGGEKREIIICYEFDKSKFAEAMENICKQLGSFLDGPEFVLFADLDNPHPYFILQKSGEV